MTTVLLLAILAVLIIGLGVLPKIGSAISGAFIPILLIYAMATTDNDGRLWIIISVATLLAVGYMLLAFDKFSNSNGNKRRKGMKSTQDQLAAINEKQRKR
ncbi:hypothetical protein [Vreelandella sp.]|uniref:hypothetical protein n=1 Tax=Vreelandella sp. TaxID=3137778 RepID=UPI003BA9DF6D